MPRAADWFVRLDAGSPGTAEPPRPEHPTGGAAPVGPRVAAVPPAPAAVLACLVALCVLGPALSRWPYAQIHLDARNLPPGAAHWFGTDALGRDLFARTWVGGRISLGVGAFAAAVDLGVGAVLGTVAGLAGGAGDAVLMRAVDVLYGVPFLLVAILLLAVFGPGLPAIVLAIALVNWLGMARLVRGQVLQLRGRPHLVAARALGLPPARLAARHVLPAVAGPALAWLSFNVPSAIFLEAFLSYLGLGVQPPVPSWGSMIAGGAQAFPLHPYPFVFPAAALCATMAALYALGDALRDRFDPRSAGRP